MSIPIKNPVDKVLGENNENETQKVSNHEVFLEDVYGYFPMVTAAPTWQPRRFRESMAYDTTNNKLYIFNFITGVWRSVAFV